MSLLNTDEDLGIPEEPVKSVEMEDVSATEMDIAPSVSEEEPAEILAAQENQGSPVDMERNSPIEGLPDENNDAEMETSNEMEISPAEKDSADVPMEAEKPADEDADMEKPVSEPDPDLVEAAKTLDEDSTSIQVNEDSTSIQVNEDSTSTQVNEDSTHIPLKEDSSLPQGNTDSNLDQVNEDANLNPANEDLNQVNDSVPIKINEDSISNQLNEDTISNQDNLPSDQVPAPESEEVKDDDADSNGRASATNFATFDDESRMSGEKLSVDNVEDVNITENAADEAEGESTAEQEGEDPLLASAEDAEASKPEVEEEILGAHSTHIPASEDKVDSKIDGQAESEKADDPEKSNEVPKSTDAGDVECINDETVLTKKIEEYEKLESALEELCHQCNSVKDCFFKLKTSSDCNDKFYLCSEECCTDYGNRPKIKAVESMRLRVLDLGNKNEEASVPEGEPDLLRRCHVCKLEISVSNESKLSWQSLDFCGDSCIEKYQNELGACCASCKGDVPQASMGKYCVRFGYYARQFCSSKCLEEFKKGLKVCSYCQRDISEEAGGFLAPLGDKGQFKDFCSKNCMDDYDTMVSNKPKPIIEDNCAVCSEKKKIEIQVLQASGVHRLCSGPCFAAFQFANNIITDNCGLCERQFDENLPGRQRVYYDDQMHNFCSKKCLNVHTLSSRKIVSCSWCKVKKYNFDMIQTKHSPGNCASLLCSLKCLQLYKVSVSASNTQSVKCDLCSKVAQGMYHLTMSDSTIRNFCCYQCCLSYQSRYSSSPFMDTAQMHPTPAEANVPIISSVTSLAPVTQNSAALKEAATLTQSPAPVTATAATSTAQHIKIVQQTFVKPAPVKTQSNKMTSCRPCVSSKATMYKPQTYTKSCQTDFEEQKVQALVPIPVPIYVPVPLAMYSFPLPMPVPFPLPIPVPIFVPTTRNSSKGIFKEIKRIADQVPRDPFEAELLMMAEMVAEDKKGNVTSESDDDDDRGNADMGAPSPIQDDSDDASPAHTPAAPTEPVTPGFGGEDILQMAVNMAMEMTEPPPPPPQSQSLDLEAVLTPQPVIPIQPPPLSTLAEERNDTSQRGSRKRGRGRGTSNNNWTSAKRTRASSRDLSHAHTELVPHHEPALHERPAVDNDNEPVIEPDPDLQLKFTYGVLAFRKWIKEKNSELALSTKSAKPFKTDILQLSTDELNYTLCMFVKEVRKPDGDEYAPDIIFYLCLGIQLYLYRSGRVDNIFTDAFYEKFTECLNLVSLKFVSRLSDRALLTRVEEEHLWESQQLGAHSPHVLLFTLMYFNTKYFYLTEVEDHMRLSFTHVMKHWKRNNTQPGKSGPSRNVLLRYYPPQAVLDADERKKKVYEQQENESNPLRCPVKLYEFYVSKCPESVRGRNDVFYLLPERSCVPDSPVWYSTMSLPKEAVGKMLNRIRMVREILCILHSLDYQ